jgi:hypothetical protein
MIYWPHPRGSQTVKFPWPRCSKEFRSLAIVPWIRVFRSSMQNQWWVSFPLIPDLVSWNLFWAIIEIVCFLLIDRCMISLISTNHTSFPSKTFLFKFSLLFLFWLVQPFDTLSPKFTSCRIEIAPESPVNFLGLLGFRRHVKELSCLCLLTTEA